VALAQLGPYRLRSETAGIVAVARAWAALERPAQSIRRGA
jgi:16S rRNA U1498 N3-methylase RsmE